MNPRSSANRDWHTYLCFCLTRVSLSQYHHGTQLNPHSHFVGCPTLQGSGVDNISLFLLYLLYHASSSSCAFFSLCFTLLFFLFLCFNLPNCFFSFFALLLHLDYYYLCFFSLLRSLLLCLFFFLSFLFRIFIFFDAFI